MTKEIHNRSIKNFLIDKGKSFIDNKNLKVAYLGKKKLHLNESNKETFVKNLLSYINRED